MTCSNQNGYVQRGNTVRLTALFKDWEGEPIDPDAVKVIIYDRKWQKLHDDDLGPGHHLDTGSYFYDYVPEQTGTYYVEWQGRIEGLPSLHRSTLIVRDL